MDRKAKPDFCLQLCVMVNIKIMLLPMKSKANGDIKHTLCIIKFSNRGHDLNNDIMFYTHLNNNEYHM